MVDSQSIQRILELCTEQSAKADIFVPSFVQSFFVKQNLPATLGGVLDDEEAFVGFCVFLDDRSFRTRIDLPGN